jgi:hypothetical protein
VAGLRSGSSPSLLPLFKQTILADIATWDYCACFWMLDASRTGCHLGIAPVPRAATSKSPHVAGTSCLG